MSVRPLVDGARQETSPNIILQTNLLEMGLAFDPGCLHGIEGHVATRLNRIIFNEDPGLIDHFGESERLKAEALSCSKVDINRTIKLFMDHEPYVHIGTIFSADEELKRRRIVLTDKDQGINTELTSFHISAARYAIESVHDFTTGSSPSVLWNYFDRILNRLETEFMKIGHLDRGLAQGIIDDITEYREVQERLVFEK